MRQIILDTETTGLSTLEGHRIIEIGCLEMVNRRLTGNTLHYYLNPKRRIDRAAEEVHGLTESFLQDKPVFSDIADALLKFVRGAELVIHNAPFDIGFLNYEFKLSDVSARPITDYCSVVDTFTLARRKHPGQKNSLDALCRRYHVDHASRDFHGALLDAELLAEVYLLMTGGQTQLFSNESEVKVKAPALSQDVSERSAPTRVVRATASELTLHEAFLAMMTKKGHCHWASFDAQKKDPTLQ